MKFFKFRADKTTQQVKKGVYEQVKFSVKEKPTLKPGDAFYVT